MQSVDASRPPSPPVSVAMKEAVSVLPRSRNDAGFKHVDAGGRSQSRRGWILWLATFLLLTAGLTGVTLTSSWPGRAAMSNDSLSQHAATANTMAAATDVDACDAAERQTFEEILVVVKTGSSIVYQRALIHLHTTLRCLPHTLLVSDADIDVGAFKFVDVIKDLDADTLSDVQLDYYRHLRDRNDEAVPTDLRDKAWNLDKFKFIPMLHRAWQERRTQTKWFVFMEADTLIDWRNLRTMLAAKDASQPLYLGAPTWINDFVFAHGGSGFVLSRPAMQKAVGDDPRGWLSKWGSQALHECCGDYLLARALSSFDVNVTSVYPLLQGDSPQLAPTLPNFWCRPVVSMHHVAPQQIASYWTEAAKNTSRTMMWRDVYRAFLEPHMRDLKLEWDNHSLDWEFDAQKQTPLDSTSDEDRLATKSSADCQRRCRRESDCRQWSFHANVCKMGRDVRSGDPVTTDDKTQWISGWLMDRIEAWQVSEQAKCAEGAKWDT